MLPSSPEASYIGVMRIARDLRSTTRAVQWLLVGTLLLGVGQQIFVVTRNPLLIDLGMPAEDVPLVQGVGAAAGVIAGLIAWRWSAVVSATTLFVACALLQTAGFALQAASTSVAVIIAGAAIAGLAIQLNTAVAPPVLKAATHDEVRVSTFTTWSLALFPAAGIVAATLVWTTSEAIGGGVPGARAALTVATLLTALAALPLLRTGLPGPSHEGRPPAIVDRRRVLGCIAFQAVLGFGSGITLPFLQVYFRVTFGIPVASIAVVHLATMAVGLLSFALAPAIVARFGLVRALVGLQLAAVPFLLQLWLARGVVVAAVAFVARHTIMSAATPLFQTFQQEITTREDGRAVASLGMVVTSIAWAAGTFAAGPLIARAHGRFDLAIVATALIQAGVALAGAIAFPRWWKSRRADGSQG